MVVLGRVAAYLLFCVTGVSVWFNLNGMWLQLPVFLDLPVGEGKAIADLMNLTGQSGNLLVLYWLLTPERLHPSPARLVGALFAISATVAVLFGLFWQVQVNHHSVALIALAGAAGSVGCLMNIAVWPFGSQYQPFLINALSTSTGVSTLLPGIIALIQRPGHAHMRLSTRTFFFIGAGMYTVSFLTLLVIRHTAAVRPFVRRSPASSSVATAINEDNAAEPANTVTLPQYRRLVRQRGMVFFIMAVLSFGIAPGMQPYLVPTGHDGLLLFTMLGQLATVVGSFVALGVSLLLPNALLLTQYSSLAAMCLCKFLGGEGHIPHYVQLMWVLNCLFNFCFGLNITQLLMAVPHVGKSAAPLLQSAPTTHLPHPQHYSRVMGGCITMGAGFGALGFFLVARFATRL